MMCLNIEDYMNGPTVLDFSFFLFFIVNEFINYYKNEDIN